MVEVLKSFVQTVKQFKLWLGIVLNLSVITAIVNESIYKQKYVASFEMAPFYEVANDLGQEFKRLHKAIEAKDSLRVYSILGQRVPLNFIDRSSYVKRNKGADYSFKHINLRLSLIIDDSSRVQLKKWDKILFRFCDKYISDSIRNYRGIQVWKEKLKYFEESNYKKFPNDSMYGFYKSTYLDQDVKLSESTLNKLIYLQTLGEYKSGFINNYYQNLETSIRLIPRSFKWYELFLMISFSPVLLITFVIRTIKYG